MRKAKICNTATGSHAIVRLMRTLENETTRHTPREPLENETTRHTAISTCGGTTHGHIPRPAHPQTDVATARGNLQAAAATTTPSPKAP